MWAASSLIPRSEQNKGKNSPTEWDQKYPRGVKTRRSLTQDFGKHVGIALGWGCVRIR